MRDRRWSNGFFVFLSLWLSTKKSHSGITDVQSPQESNLNNILPKTQNLSKKTKNGVGFFKITSKLGQLKVFWYLYLTLSHFPSDFIYCLFYQEPNNIIQSVNNMAVIFASFISDSATVFPLFFFKTQHHNFLEGIGLGLIVVSLVD